MGREEKKGECIICHSIHVIYLVVQQRLMACNQCNYTLVDSSLVCVHSEEALTGLLLFSSKQSSEDRILFIEFNLLRAMLGLPVWSQQSAVD